MFSINGLYQASALQVSSFSKWRDRKSCTDFKGENRTYTKGENRTYNSKNVCYIFFVSKLLLKDIYSQKDVYVTNILPGTCLNETHIFLGPLLSQPGFCKPHQYLYLKFHQLDDSTFLEKKFQAFLISSHSKILKNLSSQFWEWQTRSMKWWKKLFRSFWKSNH